MSVFLSKYFQGTKATIAGISMLGSGLVLGWGIVASKMIYIIGGGFGMLAPGFLLIDSSVITKKVRETFEQIKHQAERLNHNLDEMTGQNQILNRSNLTLQDSIGELRTIIRQLENNELDLVGTREALRKQVEKLEKMLAEAQDNLAEDHVQLEELKAQVEKLRQLHENAKKLLITLATAGDMFTGFSGTLSNKLEDLDQTQSELDQTTVGLDQTLSTMNNLLLHLTETSFQKLDSNQDGQISEEEFRINLNKL